MELANPPARDVAAPRLTAMPRASVVTLLTRAGSQHIDDAALLADIAAGAPVNADGSINVIAYAAWLARSLAQREGVHGD